MLIKIEIPQKSVYKEVNGRVHVYSKSFTDIIGRVVK